MSADQAFPDAPAFAEQLRRLRAARRKRVIDSRATRMNRTALNRIERAQVLCKTGGRCHICGGTITENDWQADHVLAHSSGGAHDVANYLPAHSLCNNYRWHYDTEEFQWILKLGVWLRTQIERRTSIGIQAADQFTAHERRRSRRRKRKPDSAPEM